MKEKLCYTCNTSKDLEEFYNDKNRPDGKTTQCKSCMTEYRKSRKEISRLYMENRRNSFPEKVKEEKRVHWENKNPIEKMLSHARRRAKNRGWEFTITEKDLVIPEFCPYLEVPFIVGKKNDYFQTHTIDRTDTTRGYVPGNVQVITMKANSMKNNATISELLLFAKNIILKFGNDDIVQTIQKCIETRNKES